MQHAVAPSLDAAITAEDCDVLEATDADACVDTTRKVEFLNATLTPWLQATPMRLRP